MEAKLAKVDYHMVVPFTCYHRATQPTYHELFEYASDQPDAKFKGSVVLLQNGLWCAGRIPCTLVHADYMMARCTVHGMMMRSGWSDRPVSKKAE